MLWLPRGFDQTQAEQEEQCWLVQVLGKGRGDPFSKSEGPHGSRDTYHRSAKHYPVSDGKAGSTGGQNPFPATNNSVFCCHGRRTPSSAVRSYCGRCAPQWSAAPAFQWGTGLGMHLHALSKAGWPCGGHDVAAALFECERRGPGVWAEAQHGLSRGSCSVRFPLPSASAFPGPSLSSGDSS